MFTFRARTSQGVKSLLTLYENDGFSFNLSYLKKPHQDEDCSRRWVFQHTGEGTEYFSILIGLLNNDMTWIIGKMPTLRGFIR